eukprot:1194881-Amorphochlora_amoeboformis.AAC.1
MTQSTAAENKVDADDSQILLDPRDSPDRRSNGDSGISEEAFSLDIPITPKRCTKRVGLLAWEFGRDPPDKLEVVGKFNGEGLDDIE